MIGFGASGARDEESEPVIRDNRRIDPVTGEVRGTAGSGAAAEAGVPAEPVAAQAASGAPGAGPVDLSAAELDLARQEAAERTADLQRVTAEYANYRKRVDRDREQVTTAAKSAVVLELLTVLDDLDRARAHGDLVGSFGAVADKLTGALTKLGLQTLGTVGDHFDPAVHEAVQFSTSTEVAEPTVTSVFRSGYSLGDRLVRPAVVVVTGPENDGPAVAEVVSDGAGPRPPVDTEPESADRSA